MHYAQQPTGTDEIRISGPAPEISDTASDWRKALPVLTAAGVKLRELRLSDAASLVTVLSTEEVAKFISPAPSSVDGFERFILWAQRERAAGRFICYGIVAEGSDAAVGVIQLRPTEPTFTIAEWGFALGSTFWGTGIFVKAAQLVANFVFNTVGVQRLEARATLQNARANGALNKLGATREAVLPKSFLRGDEYLDQVLWTIAVADWRRGLMAPSTVVH